MALGILKIFFFPNPYNFAENCCWNDNEKLDECPRPHVSSAVTCWMNNESWKTCMLNVILINQ